MAIKIIVCIKQVPDTAEVRIDPETHTLVREGVESILNPLDTFALEEGARIREAHGGEVVALSMGPHQAREALREAIALGADRGVLVSGREFAGSDTWATSYALARAIQHEGDAGLIICGKQAIDGDTAQVGPGIAAHLGIAQLTYVRKVIGVSGRFITVECITDSGHDTLCAQLPAVMTVVKELNEPRLPSLATWCIARGADIPVLSASDIGAEAADIGLNGSPTRVRSIHTPDRTKETVMLSCVPTEAAGELLRALKEKGLC